MTTFLEAAQAAVDDGVRFAEEQGLSVAVAVIDATGGVCAAARMDGTRSSSYEVVCAKANTALQLGRSTKDLRDSMPIDRKFSVIEIMGSIIFVAGGLPIFSDGKLIGALGVGGAAEEEDGECAEHSLAAFLAIWEQGS